MLNHIPCSRVGIGGGITWDIERDVTPVNKRKKGDVWGKYKLDLGEKEIIVGTIHYNWMSEHAGIAPSIQDAKHFGTVIDQLTDCVLLHLKKEG